MPAACGPHAQEAVLTGSDNLAHLAGVRTIAVPASIDMVNVLGPRDEFLRILERDLAADIHVRGNEVTLRGTTSDVAMAADVLTELITILRTGQGLTADAVAAAAKDALG